jgi:hypothetical protein
MARFYFDVRLADKITADSEGEDQPDAAAAQREAIVAALHLAKELMGVGRESLVVEVRDEEGQRVARAKLSLDVEPTIILRSDR